MNQYLSNSLILNLILGALTSRLHCSLLMFFRQSILLFSVITKFWATNRLEEHWNIISNSQKPHNMGNVKTTETNSIIAVMNWNYQKKRYWFHRKNDSYFGFHSECKKKSHRYLWYCTLRFDLFFNHSIGKELWKWINSVSKEIYSNSDRSSSEKFPSIDLKEGSQFFISGV